MLLSQSFVSQIAALEQIKIGECNEAGTLARFVRGDLNVIITDHRHNVFKFHNPYETNFIIQIPMPPLTTNIYQQQTAKFGNIKVISFIKNERCKERLKYFKQKINIKKYKIKKKIHFFIFLLIYLSQ